MLYFLQEYLFIEAAALGFFLIGQSSYIFQRLFFELCQRPDDFDKISQFFTSFRAFGRDDLPIFKLIASIFLRQKDHLAVNPLAVSTKSQDIACAADL